MVVCYILKVSLCENRQKQQKETLSYFELETLLMGLLIVEDLGQGMYIDVSYKGFL